MISSGTKTASLVSFVDQKSETVYGWLDTIMSFCESSAASKYVKLKSICTETLTKYMEGENSISAALPAKFGIVIDGCSFNSEYSLAVFAAFGHAGHSETILIAMAPVGMKVGQ